MVENILQSISCQIPVNVSGIQWHKMESKPNNVATVQFLKVGQAVERLCMDDCDAVVTQITDKEATTIEDIRMAKLCTSY